jgi:hypothetical protein
VVTYLKGVDPFQSSKRYKENNGQWIEPDIRLLVWNCTEILNGIADFNKQLKFLVPKPEKELLQIPASNKTDVFPCRHLCHQ